LIRPTSHRVFTDERAAATATVGERRRSIRRAQQAEKGRSVSLRMLVVAGLVLVLVLAGLILYNSSFLSITEVRVEGAEHLSSERLTELAAVPADSTLLRVDADGISARLETDPWVKRASVAREFPGVLVLNIEERSIAASVEIIPDTTSAQITHWLISDDAVWLGALDGAEQTAAFRSDEAADLPMFKDISRAVRPLLGVASTDEGIVNALAILAGFSEEMRGLVASISAPDRTKTTLNLTNNVGVAFGAADDITAKESAIITLLNAHPNTITYINVRVPDRATYRAVE
jgi:cell division protein FtsQ